MLPCQLMEKIYKRIHYLDKYRVNTIHQLRMNLRSVHIINYVRWPNAIFILHCNEN